MAGISAMCQELAGTIVGMNDVTEQLVIGILCRGHCILQGMPGLAKTLLISQLASLMDLTFHRIQFTPDLMPADITGGDVLEEDRTTGKRVFRFLQGPLFANLVLADEINRTPPKTQSALLEAMEERQLSVGGKTYPLPEPFFVLATQNPIEVEGTYPLPEAQLDRFLMKIKVSYPSRKDEWEICRRQTTDYSHDVEHVIDVPTLIADAVDRAEGDRGGPRLRGGDRSGADDAAGRGQAAGRPARQGALRRRSAGQHRAVDGRQGAGAVAQAVPRDDGRYLRSCACPCCGTASFRRSTPKRPGSTRTRSSKRWSNGIGRRCGSRGSLNRREQR